MIIANPVYDVVFKYLMEDNKVAKIFLAALTELDIVSLDFMPQELSIEKSKEEQSVYTALNLSVYRLDFSARIRQSNGSEKVIIIEIQKSKFTHENMRFRKYLGKQYMNGALFRWMSSVNGRKYKSGIPILPIYFLGEKIEGFDDVPVLKVGKTVIDRYNKKILDEKHDFIESLFHEGIIVNIPALSKKRRDEVEKLLSIFDQENRSENHHIMNVQEIEFPEKFRPIIRRLQAAAAEKEVQDIMIVEDDFLAEINDYEHRIAESNLQKEEERRQKEEAVRLLLKSGMSKSEISKALQIPVNQLDKL